MLVVDTVVTRQPNQPNFSNRSSILTIVADVRRGGRVVMTIADKSGQERDRGSIFASLCGRSLWVTLIL